MIKSIYSILLVQLLFYGAICEHLFGITALNVKESESAKYLPLFIEINVIVAFLHIFRKRLTLYPKECNYILLYFAWCLLSGIYNEGSIVSAIKYSRYSLYAIMIYISACNEYFDIKDMLNFKKYAVYLFFLQIIASLVYIFLLGERFEWRVGTMAISGGELATVFPLIAMGYVMGTYFCKDKKFAYILASFAFGIVGFSSGKRAIYFVMPVFFLLSYGIYFLIERCAANRNKLIVYVPELVVAILLLVPIVAFGISKSEYISKQDSSPIGDVFTHAIQSAIVYETAERDSGVLVGRTSATTKIFSASMDPFSPSFYIGNGPSIVMGTANSFDELNIEYGIVGFTRDIVSIGWIGAILFIVAYMKILIRMFRVYSTFVFSADLRAIAYGTFFGFVVLLYTHVFYGSVFSIAGTLGFLLMFCAGTLLRFERKIQAV